MIDYNNPAVAANLPSYLSQTAYTQAGGMPGGYAGWVNNQIQKGMQNAMYTQYDPGYFMGQDNFDNSTGMGGQIQRNEFGQPTNLPNELPANTNNQQNNQAAQPATPSAQTALGGGARSLQNRKPGLAGGFTGWSGNQSGQGNSNFNYYSRFA